MMFISCLELCTVLILPLCLFFLQLALAGDASAFHSLGVSPQPQAAVNRDYVPPGFREQVTHSGPILLCYLSNTVSPTLQLEALDSRVVFSSELRAMLLTL